MPWGPRKHGAARIRSDVYRLFLALTRFVIDPLVAGQAPAGLYQDQAANVAIGQSD